MKLLTFNVHSQPDAAPALLHALVGGILAEMPDVIALQEGNQSADAPLADAMCVGVGHHAQRLFQHLGIVIQPQHLHAGVGQAHDDTAAHGARADHGGGLDIEAGLAHCGSPRRWAGKTEDPP